MKTIYLAGDTSIAERAGIGWHQRADMLLGAYFHVVDPLAGDWAPAEILELEQADMIRDCDIVLARYDDPSLYLFSDEKLVIVFGSRPPWYIRLLQLFPIRTRLYETLEQATAYLIKRHGTNVQTT